MKTPEHRVAAALVRAAKEEHVYLRKCHWEGRMGAPDYIALSQGRAFFIETKAPGERPRPSQRAEFERIRTEGHCPVITVDSVEIARTIIMSISAAQPLIYLFPQADESFMKSIKLSNNTENKD